jgi:hypothetical protein
MPFLPLKIKMMKMKAEIEDKCLDYPIRYREDDCRKIFELGFCGPGNPWAVFFDNAYAWLWLNEAARGLIVETRFLCQLYTCPVPTRPGIYINCTLACRRNVLKRHTRTPAPRNKLDPLKPGIYYSYAKIPESGNTYRVCHGYHFPVLDKPNIASHLPVA